MSIINGHVTGETLGVAERACIELLEKVLEDARNGKVNSVAVIACGPTDFGAAIAGPDAARLNLGLDYAKADIQTAIRGGATPEQPLGRGRLVRPGFRR